MEQCSDFFCSLMLFLVTVMMAQHFVCLSQDLLCLLLKQYFLLGTGGCWSFAIISHSSWGRDSGTQRKVTLYRSATQEIWRWQGKQKFISINLRFEAIHFKAAYQYTEAWIKHKHTSIRIGLFPEGSKVNCLYECKLFNAK